jgi:hypothetical protein
VEVKVPSAALYERLSAVYDFTHAFQRNGDGSVSADVLANAAERALLRAEGVQFVRTLEDEDSALKARADREASRAREQRARELAVTGKAKGKSAIPFLYVEAHTKAATPTTSPTMMLSFAGADGVYGTASEMPILRDPDVNLVPRTPYMYHRHLVRVSTVEPKTVRVASSAGGTDTATVSEWVGTTRPPHAAGYQRGFFNRYMDPTEITARSTTLPTSSTTSPSSSTCRTSRTATAARPRR